MPDIDVDFCFERRGEVIEYVRQKYGRDSVGQIVTFGTLKSRAAIKDVGRDAGLHARRDRRARQADSQPAELLAHDQGGDRADLRGAPAVRKRRAVPAAPRLRDRRSKDSRATPASTPPASSSRPGPLDNYVPIFTTTPRGWPTALRAGER